MGWKYLLRVKNSICTISISCHFLNHFTHSVMSCKEEKSYYVLQKTHFSEACRQTSNFFSRFILQLLLENGLFLRLLSLSDLISTQIFIFLCVTYRRHIKEICDVLFLISYSYIWLIHFKRVFSFI